MPSKHMHTSSDFATLISQILCVNQDFASGCLLLRSVTFGPLNPSSNVYFSVRVEERMECSGTSIASHVAELATREMDSSGEEPELPREVDAELATQEMHSSDEEPELPREVDAELATQEMHSSDEEPELPREVDAELATQEMHSSGEEPELPREVEYIIQRLEGKKGEPVTMLSNLIPTFHVLCREFFPERPSLSTITGWQSQVRLRVLEAIGNCNTLEYLEVGDICEQEISKLTDTEWDVVLRGFRSSTILRDISLGDMGWSSDTEVRSLCLQLGKILSTSSVTHMRIGCRPLSAECFLNLASGLRGSSDPKLQYLELQYFDLWDACRDLNVVKSVADMINSAPRLQTLRLEDLDYEDEETVGILSQALIHNSSLKELILEDIWSWGAALLLKALAGDDRNRSIERLQVDTMDGIVDCIRELLNSNPSLKEVSLYYLRMRPEEWHQLGEVIRDNATSTTILVKFHCPSSTFRDDFGSIEALASAASSDVKDPKLELELGVNDHDGWMLSLNLLGSVLRGEIKSLKSLILWGLRGDLDTPDTNQDRMRSIMSMNGKSGETSVLKRLQLSIPTTDRLKGVWKDLFRCLRGNTSLTHLDLSPHKNVRGLLEYQLHEESFRDLMGLLRVNLTLEEIDVSGTSWETDGKATQIEEALKQNRKRAIYMSVFREAKLTFGDAKAGRLFLCGSPKAGKTELRRTLMSVIQGRSWLASTWDRLRTKGIEVEFLQNDEEMQLSVWDLAGQWIFRTLQNVLFPQTNNFCVFLFVYSPICEETSSIKPDHCFRIELEEWLSFITSSTKVTGHNLPQVIVVISHKDKTRFPSLTWARSIVEELTKRFANFVDLRQEFFHVDARDNKHVIPLKSHVFGIFEKLLSEKSPQVPHLCFQLTSLLVKNTKKNRSRPLWPYEEFYDFCAPSLTQYIPSSSFHLIDHSRIMDSIISYLNDVGSIIYIPNLDFIIVDPNWLTNTFLGELIALGQHFQADDSKSTDNTMSSDSNTSKDGFVSESVFAGLIEEFLGKQPHGQRGVDRELLEKILVHLDLCFKLENTSQYFIPSFIPEHASKEEQNHQEGAHVKSMYWANRSETSQFVGIRIQCQDGRTMSLTTAFFPRFQMFMRRKLISEMRASEKNVTCSRHYLRLFLDGHQIYVEHVQGEKSHKYVDVLMLCSSHKSREVATKYVMKHIVQELISFCASPKGCPGVTLVLGVIQTHCVKMLIPSHLRGSILIEELKANFSRSINDQLEEMPLEKLHLLEKKELFHYEHCWPPIERHGGEISERARDLLWESDVEEVVTEIRQKQIQQLEALHGGLISVNNDYPEAENMVSDSKLPQMKDCKPPTSRCLSRASTNVESRSTRLFLWKMDQILQKVYGLDERLRSVENVVQRFDMKMGQILSLQQDLQSTLGDFMSKMDRITDYSQAFQQSGTPKRPYVTNDIGIFYRMNADLHYATTVRLQLMCESITGFHTVKDQKGLMIRLDQENSSWISKTIKISYKLMYYAVKAGLDVTLGLGQAIPDWEDLKSDVVQVGGISDDDRRAFRKGGKSKELQGAWLRIQQTLAPQLENRYSEIFKLYQVEYVNLEKGGHAWVCEKCMNKGLRCGILKF